MDDGLLRLIVIITVSVGIAVSMWIATVWLVSDDTQNNQGGKMKKYQVYVEIVVTKEVAVIFAETEEEAIEKAQNAVGNIVGDLGSDNSEMVWAEEIPL